MLYSYFFNKRIGSAMGVIYYLKGVIDYMGEEI